MLPYDFRRAQLQKLARALIANEQELLTALSKDLGKSAAQAYTSELAIIHYELKFTLRHLKGWMKPARVKTPLHLLPARSGIHFDPLGVVLIIGPWNYPVQLTLLPLIGALAAGNTVLIKPSEIAAHSSTAIRALIEGAFPPDEVVVVEGGLEPTTELLKQKFDHIFFTGSTAVGRIVYEAAAKALTPVTLELGGKSPVIIDADADVELAARRIAWGKFLNAGQTCVAPDYVYVHESVQDRLIRGLEKSIYHQFGHEPGSSPDFGRIINERNFNRLLRLMESGRILYGGQKNAAVRYIAPTLIGDLGWDDPIMHEEIFGPLLPVLTFKDMDEVFGTIKAHAKPLSAYLFSNSSGTQRRFLTELPFGGGCINDTVLHLANAHLPFGGVGESGIGSYRGEHSFRTFSHQKSVLHKSRFWDVWLRYPPFTSRKAGLLKTMFGLSAKLD